jgi:hypothetical protein
VKTATDQGVHVQCVEFAPSLRLILGINLDTNRIYSADTHGVPFAQRIRCNNTENFVRKTRVVSPEARPWADQSRSTPRRL